MRQALPFIINPAGPMCMISEHIEVGMIYSFTSKSTGHLEGTESVYYRLQHSHCVTALASSKCPVQHYKSTLHSSTFLQVAARAWLSGSALLDGDTSIDPIDGAPSHIDDVSESKHSSQAHGGLRAAAAVGTYDTDCPLRVSRLSRHPKHTASDSLSSGMFTAPGTWRTSSSCCRTFLAAGAGAWLSGSAFINGEASIDPLNGAPSYIDDIGEPKHSSQAHSGLGAATAAGADNTQRPLRLLQTVQAP